MKHQKLSPGLLVALEDLESEGARGLVRTMLTLGVNPNLEKPAPAKTVVFIHCESGDANLDRLAEHDIYVNQSSGKIRTAYLPLTSLDPLTDAPEVQRVVSSRFMRPLMDVAAGRVNIPRFRTNSGLSGQGTIVGIVDSGIDTQHSAFAGRILRVWDQTLTGQGVAEGAFGIELTGSQVALSNDDNGHGTHVAGIASGDDQTFGGIAPAASLVIVKTDFQDAHISDGIRYIFRLAKELNLPAVVNLSLGGHFDAHDGTDSLSQIIDSESGPGRIVCCAAGNEGEDNIHAQALLSGGSNVALDVVVPAGAVRECLLNGWYPGASSFEVSVVSPGGNTTPPQPVIQNGNPVRTFNLPDGRVRITTPGPDPSNRDHHFLIDISGRVANSSVAGGVWQLKVQNVSQTAGQLDVWTLDGEESPVVVFDTASADNSTKIGSPGCSLGAITVGAFTTKQQWTDIDGTTESVQLTLDDVSSFSSPGPLRLGTRKPEVTAPGAMIGSAFSSASQATRSDLLDATHVVKAGTSMATPFICGIVALLLHRDRNLDPAGVKALLQTNSAIPQQPAGTFNPKWGFGLIDALGL